MHSCYICSDKSYAMESTDSFVIYNVGLESEFRFSVGEEIPVQLELISGFAEIFGYQLVQKKIYTLPPYTSLSLFSWKGCQVKLWGITEKASLSSKTMMMAHANKNVLLEEMRTAARHRNQKGPICLVVGPHQSGKTAFCRFLLNYACRMEWHPLYVDMNVTNNTLSLPGVISALPVESQLDLTTGLNPQGLSVFNYGLVNPKMNLPLYYLLVKTLGEMLYSRLDCTDPKSRNSGVVVDTCGWIVGKGYAGLVLAARAFHVDVVFVVKNKRLYSRFENDMPDGVKVVFIPKHEAVVRKTRTLRKDIQANKVWEYFYGPNHIPLKPFQFEVKFVNVEIYRAKPPKKSDRPAIDPFKVTIKDIQVERVGFTQKLLNRILGISYAEEFHKNTLVASVKGFVCVLKVDTKRKVLTVLSPQPAPLPNRFLIQSDIKLKRYCKKDKVLKTVDYSVDKYV